MADPVISSLAPAAADPGQEIFISGRNFGAQPGTGYVLFADNGVNWGQPGDLAALQLVNWGDTQIVFLVPVASHGFQTTPGTTATVTVTTGGGLTSNAATLAIKPAAPVITSLNPVKAGPGDTITISGQNFGAQPGTGYVHFVDNGVNWGQPGDLATFQLGNWSDTQIKFLVPVKDSHGYQITPGTNAAVMVTNSGGRTSNAEIIALYSEPTPVINSLSSATASPGDTITINGQNFGAQPGTGYVHFVDNGVNWGQPGDLATFQLGNWSDTQISFLVPVQDSQGYQTTPGTTATVTVTNSGGLTSNAVNLLLIGVSSVSPSTGAVPMLGQPGTQVTIAYGGSDSRGTQVAFGNDTPILPASIAPDGTSLVAVVPPTAASGPLTVTQLNIAGPHGEWDAIGQVNFAVDNYRNTRGFSWMNSTGFQTLVGSPYSYADATALFGANQTVDDVNLPIIGTVNLAGPWVNLFLTIANAMLESGGGGECFGMSLASLQFAMGKASFGSFPQQSAGEPNGPPGPNVWMLDGPALGNTPPTDVSPPPLATFVHQRHLAQLSQESINAWLNFHFNVSSAAGLRNAIQQAFTAGGASRAGAIIDLSPSISEGHAVVAYGIVDTGNGNFNILMYNPNVPFTAGEDTDTTGLLDPTDPNFQTGPKYNAMSQSVINVNSDGSWILPNSHKYFVNVSKDWTGGIFNITVIPWNTVPVQPTFPWTEVVGATLLAVWIVAGDAAVTQVSDGQGHTLLANGQWNVEAATMLSGVRPMPNMGGLGKSMAPAFVSNRSGALTHTITGAAAGTYDLNWLGGGCGATLASVPTTNGANDTVVIDVGKVNFTPDHAKALTMTVLGTSSNNKLPRTATLKTTASAGGGIGLSYDAAADTFSYAHTSSPATYTIEFSSFDAQGKPATFVRSPASVANGETHIFTPDWTQLASGVGTVQVRAADGTLTSVPLK